VEGTTSSRIADAARAVEELRSQLNEEQVLRRGEDGQLAQVGAAAQGLKIQVEALHGRLHERDTELATLREKVADGAGQLSWTKETLASVQCRCVHAKIRAPCQHAHPTLPTFCCSHQVCLLMFVTRHWGGVDKHDGILSPSGGQVAG
jgi:hypothetical protein